MIPLPERGFGCASGVFQHSCGVVAPPGGRTERMRFRKPVPIAAGFARIKARRERLGRPLTAEPPANCTAPAPSPRPCSMCGLRRIG